MIRVTDRSQEMIRNRVTDRTREMIRNRMTDRTREMIRNRVTDRIRMIPRIREDPRIRRAEMVPARALAPAVSPERMLRRPEIMHPRSFMAC